MLIVILLNSNVDNTNTTNTNTSGTSAGTAMTFVGGSAYEGGNLRLGSPPYPPLIKDSPFIIASKCPCKGVPAAPIAVLKLFV